MGYGNGAVGMISNFGKRLDLSGRMTGIVLALTLFILGSSMTSAFAAQSQPWRITQETWSEADERGYSDFVAAMGAADCWNVDNCLESAANPYRHRHGNMRFRADCADFPYLFRAYYAWMNGLPFAYQNGVLPQSGWTRDIRYTRSGNRVVSRKSVPATQNGINAASILVDLRSAISTGSYRHHATANDQTYFTDMYSPEIGRDAIRPGTIVYDVNGHVVLVWRVEDDGRVLTISAHPDNSVSRSFYGRNFLRTHPRQGTGFKDWRPIRLVGARRMADGTLVGGHIEATPNEAIQNFSLMQYVGTETTDTSKRALDQWRQATFVRDGQPLDYYHYVRAAMARGNLTMEPVHEIRSSMRALCNDVRARKQAVDAAIGNGIDKVAAPGRLPQNIYGTFGYWEFYSTPSRDARLKTAMKEQRDHIESLIEMHRQGASTVTYEGTDLIGDLISAYDEESANCVTTYTRSNGVPVRLTLNDVVGRVYDLSFDPYQCIEKRWGASDPAEAASCQDGPAKDQWYRAQRFLRNQIDRTYDVDMGYTPAQLEAGPHDLFSGRGVAEGPDVDVRAYLLSLQGRQQASIDSPAVR
jgi:hypothetical protein